MRHRCVLCPELHPPSPVLRTCHLKFSRPKGVCRKHFKNGWTLYSMCFPIKNLLSVSKYIECSERDHTLDSIFSREGWARVESNEIKHLIIESYIFPEVFVFNVILKPTVSFETISAQASFKLTSWPRITLNSSFPLSPPEC